MVPWRACDEHEQEWIGPRILERSIHARLNLGFTNGVRYPARRRSRNLWPLHSCSMQQNKAQEGWVGEDEEENGREYGGMYYVYLRKNDSLNVCSSFCVLICGAQCESICKPFSLRAVTTTRITITSVWIFRSIPPQPPSSPLTCLSFSKDSHQRVRKAAKMVCYVPCYSFVFVNIFSRH